ncbi:MAG: hypothetical protein ACHQF3_13020 [Alphaproteobacteria bacterium]
MMRLEAIAALFPDLETIELSVWIERRWVEPEAAGDGGWVFHEIDVARVRLIYDLRRELEVAEETVPLVLSLLDQLYELRATLKTVTRAVEGQPSAVRDAIRAALEDREGEPQGPK